MAAIFFKVEVSELYFVPDPGASRQQCDPPIFKPVSGLEINTKDLVSFIRE